jgi:hypothetical protein
VRRGGISEQERGALFARLALRNAQAQKAPAESGLPAESTPSVKVEPVGLARSSRRLGWTLHLRKISLIASFLLAGNRIVLAIIGALNRKLLRINTVFLAYPGSDAILKRYCYGALRDWAFWRPTLIGAYNQAGSWGLIFAIARTENDFDRPDSADRLRELYLRMESIRKITRAREVRFAGVLPGKFHADGVSTSDSEVNAAVAAVLRAEVVVRNWEQIDIGAPVIVLGANGFVGRRLMSQLVQRDIHPVDVGPSGASFPNRDSWPAQLVDKRALLINVARSDSLTLYLDLLWSSLVILNEAYPAPGQQVLEKLSALNCSCYHLAGAVGDSYPDFPWPYAGAVPCCAAQITDETALMVRRLT